MLLQATCLEGESRSRYINKTLQNDPIFSNYSAIRQTMHFIVINDFEFQKCLKIKRTFLRNKLGMNVDTDDNLNEDVADDEIISERW